MKRTPSPHKFQTSISPTIYIVSHDIKKSRLACEGEILREISFVYEVGEKKIEMILPHLVPHLFTFNLAQNSSDRSNHLVIFSAIISNNDFHILVHIM